MKLLARLLLTSLVCLSLAAPAGVAGSGPTWRWASPGIVITSFNAESQQITALDNGAAICRAGSANAGVGGNCVPFSAMGKANAIVASEDVSLTASNVLAFQVCVDNNGDGICLGSPDVSDDVAPFEPASCTQDTIVYSHSTTTGKNRPALHVPDWAEQHWRDCGELGYAGYVVLICGGVHNNAHNTQPHLHTATQGTITPSTTYDVTTGNFCGAPTASKAYVVV